MKDFFLAFRETFRARRADWREARPRRLELLALGALVLERLARALLPAAIVVAFFVALSWTGIWLGAPSLLRVIGVSALIGALAVALYRLRGFSWPRAGAARDALDAGDPAAPAAALADRLANDGDPRTQGLWRLHRLRAARRAARLRPVAPAPRLWREDPYAIGALAILFLLVTGLVAGPEKYARVAAAFAWRIQAAESGPSRIDAWIDPPPYTGRPPIVLPLQNGASFSAPVGSAIIVRAVNAANLRVGVHGRVAPAKPAADHGDASRERRFQLLGDGRLRLSLGAEEIASIALKAVPDLPPKITPAAAPKVNLRGSFALRYRIEDDYGAHDAKAFARLEPGDASAPTHPIVRPPAGSLELPAAPGGLGEGATVLDWSDSPYAGAAVDLVLVVHDDAGNEGRAVIGPFVLPGKVFSNPLALALAEQRRILSLDAWRKDKVLAAIDALMLSPEIFTPDASVYLGLRVAHDSLLRARGDADLAAVADLLWQMALRIEEGGVPQAERDLKAAEQALRDALKNGASGEEIARLTAQLQKALDRYLAAMRDRAAKQGQANESEPGDGRLVTPEDFKAMLDRMAQDAGAGDRDAAMRMLDRLQDIIENLGSRRPSRAAGARRMMRDLDNMMREQQKLRDDTFARDRVHRGEPGAQASGQQPSGPEQPGEAAGGQELRDQGTQAPQDELARRQAQLRQKLDALEQQAHGGAGEKSEGLAQAAEAMKQAEGALRGGDNPSALSAQGRALEGLRKGAAEAAAQAERNGQGGGGEEGLQNGRGYEGRNGDGMFGDANRQRNVDPTATQRARRVLEELRRRLADPNRVREELDYLERLIRPD